jgi:DNA primase
MVVPSRHTGARPVWTENETPMGILDEDIARVRASTDFVALAGEHIALKRIGRQYQGLCPFHSEKSPSFSINPEKGVYYCYGCQASGDVISFVRELEHLDFGQAVERLAAKANITLRYDNEAAGRDRMRRSKLVEAMESAVDWYHNRLLTGPDAGAARAYLRSRGYDGELIRRFKIGYAPAGWDTLCKSLSLPTDVARDTGLGYLNKIGKVNDFFQKRILFPIFDQSGAPVAFGGRKMPDDDGPKYKNSSETKLYSKSRTLYGLNWAKSDVVSAGEVIVCEGYTDVIGFHSAGLPRAVATCGTALADEHFTMLKNYARRIVLAYDADNAGQNAAEKFYGWEKKYEIDLFVVSLPEGADPADLARKQPELLHDAVAQAKPFLAFRVDRSLRAANLKTPEGRSRGFEAAAAVVMEHPNAIVREQYLRDVAAKCQVSESLLLTTLETYGTQSVPRRIGSGGSKASNSSSSSASNSSNNSGSKPYGPKREVANSEEPPYPDYYEAQYDGPPDQGYTFGQSRNSGNSGNSGNSNSWRRPTSGPNASRARNQPRASSSSLRAEAVRARSKRAEEEALRWLLADPERVRGWVFPVLFSDPELATAVQVFSVHGELHAAIDACEADDAPHIASLFRRLAVDAPATDDFDDALALVVGNAVDRVIDTIEAQRDNADPQELAAIGNLKHLQLNLRESQLRVDALAQLVPWLSEWDEHQQEENLR